MNLISVDSLNKSQTENLFRSKYIAENRPALLKGLCKEWPAFSKWSLDYFSETYGSAELPVSYYQSNAHQKYKDKTRINMKEYVDYVKSLRTAPPTGEPMYAAGWHFAKSFSSLTQDIVIPEFFQNNLIDKIQPIMQYDWMSLFIGHAYSQSPLHTDSFFVSTWLTCIRGSKTVRLIPGDTPGITNGLDVFNDTIVENLIAKGVSVYEAKIEEGDTLFMPSGWWHHVINHDESIALSCNFVSPNNYLPFEQQIRGRILTPLVKLEKLSQEILNSEFAYCEDSLESCRYVDNEKAFLKYIQQMHTKHDHILNRLPKAN
ncbi:MAG: cupin-like domain-containing protein [Bdellovibrionales bacterium]|nr:cupin-like domain-containing protein [Bdellovibrionales bacterium]